MAAWMAAMMEPQMVGRWEYWKVALMAAETVASSAGPKVDQMVQ
jgi:hypothetical protein